MVRFQETLRMLAMTDVCRRRDLAAILTDSVALLQTPVVAEPTEAGLS